ncbi:MAG: hypothetical protein PHO83_04880 [Geobacteraceae bacterium]|nr:hypothetical protein [Geobacteraceae bacterium]
MARALADAHPGTPSVQHPEHPSADQENRKAKESSGNDGKGTTKNSFSRFSAVKPIVSGYIRCLLELRRNLSKSLISSILSQKNFIANIWFGQQAVLA